MKNKYQEALKWFQSIHDVLGQEQYYEDLGMRFGQGLHESLQIVKELVDKETPMKPYKDGKKYKCTKCVIVRVSGNRCPNCGQKIDWSDEDSEI